VFAVEQHFSMMRSPGMNKPLAMAIALFIGATMLTVSLPTQDAQAGWRRCCGARHHHRCHGRNRRCCGSYYSSGCYGGGCSGYYGGGCNGGYHGGCAGGYADGGYQDGMQTYQGAAPEDAILPPSDTPQEPANGPSAPPAGASGEATSPSDSSETPPPPPGA
jgi:hypothetical protein